MAVIEVELLLGLLLLFALFPRLVWVTSLAFFATAFVVSLSKAVAGQSSCGCFGAVTVNPWITGSCNLVAVVLLGLSGVPRDSGRTVTAASSVARRFAKLTLVIVPLGLPVTVLVSASSREDRGAPTGLDFRGERVVLTPKYWLGRPFPLHGWIDIDADLTNGEWTVVLYRPSCSHCEPLLREYDALAAAGNQQKRGVAFVEVPPHSAAGATRYFAHPDAFTLGRLDARKQWLLPSLPMQLSLRHGVVKGILPADTPVWLYDIASK